MVFCFGSEFYLFDRGTRTLRFACWQLALRAALLIGGAPLPLKTPTLRRFF